MNPATWYTLGLAAAVNGLFFIAGVATVAFALVTVGYTARYLLLEPATTLTRTVIAARARRQAWKHHQRSGRT